MANWFCSVFNVVCVVIVCRLKLIDSAWVVIVFGQKCIKNTHTYIHTHTYPHTHIHSSSGSNLLTLSHYNDYITTRNYVIVINFQLWFHCFHYIIHKVYNLFVLKRKQMTNVRRVNVEFNPDRLCFLTN